MKINRQVNRICEDKSGGVPSSAEADFCSKRVFQFTVLFLVFLALVGCSTGTIDGGTAKPGATGTVEVVGAGSVYPALEAVARDFEASNQSTRINFLHNSQTGAAITSVKGGVVHIGAVTSPLAAEEAEGRLRYREFATDALLMATHRSVVGVTNLSMEDVRAIYSGKVRNWRELGGPDAEIVVLDRPEDESAKILLREHILGKDLTITAMAINLRQEVELIKALLDTPCSLGVFSLAYAVEHHLDVNRLSIEGVAASVENVKRGRYRMVRSLGIIWLDEIPASAQAFRDFILGDEGGRVLQRADYVPSASAT